jgi:translation initiation factor 3 subunit C
LDSEEEREETNETATAGPIAKIVKFDEEAIKITGIESIFDALETILEARGKKNTDKQAQIDTLVALKSSTKTAYQKAIVLNALIPARFDFVPSITGCMTVEMWKSYFFTN